MGSAPPRVVWIYREAIFLHLFFVAFDEAGIVVYLRS